MCLYIILYAVPVTVELTVDDHRPTADASKSEFKPRKIKKKDDQYRDRAAERRTGVAGDFAEVYFPQRCK